MGLASERAKENAALSVHGGWEGDHCSQSQGPDITPIRTPGQQLSSLPRTNPIAQRSCLQSEGISNALAHQGKPDAGTERTLEVSLPVQARRSSEPRVTADGPRGSVSSVQRAHCLSAELLAPCAGSCL